MVVAVHVVHSGVCLCDVVCLYVYVVVCVVEYYVVTMVSMNMMSNCSIQMMYLMLLFVFI